MSFNLQWDVPRSTWNNLDVYPKLLAINFPVTLATLGLAEAFSNSKRILYKVKIITNSQNQTT